MIAGILVEEPCNPKGVFEVPSCASGSNGSILHREPMGLVVVGNLLLDLAGRQVRHRQSGVVVELPKKCYEILVLLVTHPNRSFGIEEIFNQLWGEESPSDVSTVKVAIYSLRKVLAKAGICDVIKAGHRTGYSVKLSGQGDGELFFLSSTSNRLAG